MRITIMLAVVLLSMPVAGLAQSDSLLCITGQTTTGSQGTQPQPPPFATCFSCDTTTTGDCDDYRSDPDAWDLEEEGPSGRRCRSCSRKTRAACSERDRGPRSAVRRGWSHSGRPPRAGGRACRLPCVAPPEHVDRKALEQRRESSSRLGPRKLDLEHAMLRTLHPRRSRVQVRHELAAVQMPPCAFLAVIVHREFPPAHRTWPPNSVRMTCTHVNALALHVQLNPTDKPGSLEPKQVPVQLDIAHGF